MKRLLASLALFACIAHAQQPSDDASADAERKRLRAEREKAEAIFKAEEKACYAKFAVNDCIAKARSRRREAVSDLRRQEVALNDAERKRKAAERQRSIDERNSPPRGAASQPSEADRQLRANERAAERAAQAASAPARAAEREQHVKQRQAEISTSAQRRAQDAAEAVKQREKREADAKEREQKMKQRQADRKKAPASSLPDPP